MVDYRYSSVVLRTDERRMERLSRVAQHVGGDLVSQLSELGQLFRDGLLTHDEFGTPFSPPFPKAPLR